MQRPSRKQANCCGLQNWRRNTASPTLMAGRSRCSTLTRRFNRTRADDVDFHPLSAALPARDGHEWSAQHVADGEFRLVAIKPAPEVAHQFDAGPTPLRLPHA